MSQDIVCPTCGGFLFSLDEESMRLAPCTCAAAGDSSSSTMAADYGEPVRVKKSAVFAALESVAPARPVAVSTKKICCNCGKDVEGHRRLKDSQGRYWCYKCGKADEKARLERESIGKGSCKRCGTEVLVQDLQIYEGEFICPKCYRESKEGEKAASARIARVNKAFAGQDMKRMTPLFIILGILMLIVLLRTFHLIGT